MEDLRRVGAVSALLVLTFATACDDRPESFQTACDHLAAAVRAASDGDAATAKEELNDAYSWGEPVYEDITGTGFKATVDDFFEGVGVALHEPGTEEGQRGLAAATEACS